MTFHMPLRSHPDARLLRLTAMLLLAVPAAVLLLFAIAEMVGGDVTGAQHIPEAALLGLLMFVAWRHPWGAGVALLVIGATLFVAWLALVGFGQIGDGDSGFELAALAAGAILFVPPLIAGGLLMWAGRLFWARG